MIDDFLKNDTFMWCVACIVFLLLGLTIGRFLYKGK
jgi:uncharacterized protein YneF (UPF0154 family)